MRGFFLFLGLLLSMVCGFAQDLYRLKGEVRDEEGVPVVGASIRVASVVGRDTVVFGGTADSDGLYQVLFEKAERIFVNVESLGYAAGERSLEITDRVTQCNFVLASQSIGLQEVVVEGKGLNLTKTGMKYYPNDNEKKMSSNGFELLRRISLPNLVVNPMDKGVTTLAQEAVSLYIDGIPASQEEVDALSPEAVLRVEYHELPTVEFMGQRNVVNFVLRQLTFGGYGRVGLNKSFLTNDNMGNGSVKIGKGNWSVQAIGGGSYTENYEKNNKRNTFERFVFADKELIRQRETEYYFSRNRVAYGMANVRYADSLNVAQINVGAYHTGTPFARNTESLTYSLPELYPGDTRTTTSDDKSVRVYLNTYYKRQMRNAQQLNTSLKVSYSDSRDNSIFAINEVPGSKVVNNSVSKGLVGEFEMGYGKGFRHNNSLNLTYKLFGQRYDNDYFGTSVSNQELEGVATSFSVGYSQTFFQKLSVYASLGLSYNRTFVNGIKRDDQLDFVPYLNVYYGINNNRLQLSAFLYADPAPIAYKNDVELVQDELLTLYGNPDLKTMNIYNMVFNYVYNIKNFSLIPNMFTQYYKDRVVSFWNPSGDRMVRTYLSDGNSYFFSAGLAGKLSLFNRTLDLSANLRYVRSDGTKYYTGGVNDFALDASVSWYYRNISVYLFYNRMGKGRYTDGSVMDVGDKYGMQVGYRLKNWLFSASAYNVFGSPDKYDTFRSHGNGNYSINESRIGSVSQVMLSVTYNFNFGKAISRDDDVDVERKVDSGILR